MILELRRAGLWLLLGLAGAAPPAVHADTVASLLGNFTINQYCGLEVAAGGLTVHYAVVFGQLPALRELHAADTDGNGVTTQAEREARVAKLARGFADGLLVRIDGVAVPLRASRWSSSLPNEQGGFSLRVDAEYAAPWPAADGAGHRLEFTNQNYAGRMGWHEIAVQPGPGMAVFDTDAYDSSLTGGLREALRALPAGGPLDERSVHLRFTPGAAPRDAALIGPRPAPTGAAAATAAAGAGGNWIERRTRLLVDSISAPHLAPRVALLALMGAMLLGAVHALSPGHGKTIVGAYLIGSRGTPRHAAFLGLTVTATHTLGVFILGFVTLYASRFIVPERLFPILSLISALLILGMGLVLLVQRARAARRAFGGGMVFHAVEPVPAPHHAGGLLVQGIANPGVVAHGLMLAPGHAVAHGVLHSHGGTLHSHLPPGAAGEQVTWRNLLALGISGGLVPCPAAMVLLLAAVALGKTAFGMVLVLAFSAGLAVTLTAVGLVFLHARNRFRTPRSAARWPQLLPLASAAVITVLGIGLCIGALRSFGA